MCFRRARLTHSTGFLWHSLSMPLVPSGPVFVHVPGFAREARPQSRPRSFWAQPLVRLWCSNINPLGGARPEPLAASSPIRGLSPPRDDALEPTIQS
jgi:hypothetical protein